MLLVHVLSLYDPEDSNSGLFGTSKTDSAKLTRENLGSKILFGRRHILQVDGTLVVPFSLRSVGSRENRSGPVHGLNLHSFGRTYKIGVVYGVPCLNSGVCIPVSTR